MLGGSDPGDTRVLTFPWEDRVTPVITEPCEVMTPGDQPPTGPRLARALWHYPPPNACIPRKAPPNAR